MNKPFVVIVMPGGLHVARLAIARVPDHVSLVVILNGLDSWEMRWATRNLRAQELLRSPTALGHAVILDLLFENLTTDFGILDYDCFVFNPECFSLMADISEQNSMNAAFFRANDELKIKVPETFFLYFNRRVVCDLRRRFDILCEPANWEDLSDIVQGRLWTIGIDANQLPEQHKDYFDTLRVLMMLSLSEHVPFRFVYELPATPTPSPEMFHVGGISLPTLVDGIWRFRGVYFWRLALKASADTELQRHYGKLYGEIEPMELVARYPDLAERAGPNFFEFCNRLLES